MNSPTSRITDFAPLHPVFREKLQKLMGLLKTNGLPFEPFETYRTPERQQFLYSKGRPDNGPKVTNAQAWRSYHQYGLAVDLVLKIDGQWSWDTSGAHAAQWKQMQALGISVGLEPLSFELPHLQLAGHNSARLLAGEYPDWGDTEWADNLEAMIVNWKGSPKPPVPTNIVGRPALPAQLQLPITITQSASAPADPATETTSPPENNDLTRPAVPPAEPPEPAMSAQAAFESTQSMIDKWEGGWSDHPADKGGPTNMGITLATLSSWRGHQVTKAELKAMPRSEQRQIMKARYWNVISGDLLPPAIAAVTYNAAILHGPGRAARFLQTVISRSKPDLKIDGTIGPLTAAAARDLDPLATVDAFIDLELSFMASLGNWSVFGKGWSNRLKDIRSFAKGLATQPVPDNGRTTPGPEVPKPQPQGILGLDNLLGSTIGNVFSGKKTAIGGLGTLAILVAEPIATKMGYTHDQVKQVTEALLPVAVGLLGWGTFAKVDKLLGAIIPNAPKT